MCVRASVRFIGILTTTGVRRIQAGGLSGEALRLQLLEEDTPAIVEGMNVGPCTQLWKADEYLIERAGETRVSVQVCEEAEMDFVQKNFHFKMMNFSDLVKCARATKDSHQPYLYFRSSPPNRTSPANLWNQWPALATSFNMPSCIPNGRAFSSVLRVCSQDCVLFTHYDTMDNLLFQIRGRKHVILFSPADYPYLYMKGDKSQVRNPRVYDANWYPLLRQAKAYECVIEPGCALYIPAFWFHNVQALDFSVAVNVFWKPLENEFYDRKDMFGNRELIPWQRSQEGISRILGVISRLPKNAREFYGRKLMLMIKNKLFDLDKSE